MHHVTKQFAGRESNLQMKVVFFLGVKLQDALVSLKERQSRVVLQIEVESFDNFLLEFD